MDFQGRVEGGRVVPLFPQDAQDLADMDGSNVRVMITQPKTRSLSQLGLYWAFCTKLSENWPGPDQIDRRAVSDLLKLEIGHSYVFRDSAGRYRLLPRSIAFNALSQERFNDVMQRALGAACLLFGADLAGAVYSDLGLDHP